MRLLRALLLWALFVPAMMCQESEPAGNLEPKAMDAPTLPFLDWKACPSEGCAYGQWTARKTVIVYDTWEPGRKQIAKLSAGDKVTGLTGLVITYEPGIIRMDKDLPEQKLKRGDTILTYTYLGGGFSQVWFNGQYYPSFSLMFTKWPDGSGCRPDTCAATYVDPGKKSWWAQIKLADGRSGWVDMGGMNGANFDGVDTLG